MQYQPAVKPARFPGRPPIALTCPHCWTEQRAERNRCYRCGAEFCFDDEAELPNREEERNRNCACAPIAL